MKPRKPILRWLRHIAFCVFFPLILFVQIEASVVINEIRTDEPGGTDSNEFIELKGIPGTSLDGYWYLVIGEHTGYGSDDGINVPDKKGGVVEFAISLDGYTIPNEGLFLITTADMQFEVLGLGINDVDMLLTTMNFENSDNTTHVLVRGYTGIEVTEFADQYDDLAVDIDDDDDGVPNATLPWAELVDAIGIVEVPNDASPEEFVYGTILGGSDIGPDGSFTPGMVYRGSNDGNWNIGEFSLLNAAGDGLFEGDEINGPALDTPGKPNGGSLASLNLNPLYECSGASPVIVNATPINGGLPFDYTYKWYFRPIGRNFLAIPANFNDATLEIACDPSSEGTWKVEVTNATGTSSAEFEFRIFVDGDGDGLSDYYEANFIGTDPNDPDTDGDGLSDGDEEDIHHTNPNLADTNSDGYEDGFLLNAGFDPLTDYGSFYDYFANVVTDIRIQSTVSSASPNGITLRLELDDSEDLMLWSNRGFSEVDLAREDGASVKFVRFKFRE